MKAARAVLAQINRKGRSRGISDKSAAGCASRLSLSDASRGAAKLPGQVPEMRHGLAAGGHAFWLASTHAAESVAPRDHGCRHGRGDGGRHDADALMGRNIRGLRTCPCCARAARARAAAPARRRDRSTHAALGQDDAKCFNLKAREKLSLHSFITLPHLTQTAQSWSVAAILV